MTRTVIASATFLSFCLWSVDARADLVVNGNFEAGNVGFTTDYTYSPGDIGPAQSYDVVDNPAHSRPHDINPVSYGDHTTGHGLMMAVNGATSPNKIVWSETMAVFPTTDYDFSLWVSSWFAGSPATLDIRFNDLSIGTPGAPSTVAVWQEFSTTWNSGASPLLTIKVYDTNLADVGSDFAMDDMSFAQSPAAVPEPGTFGMMLVLSGSVYFCGRGRRRRRQ